MTKAEFLEELKKSPRRWKLVHNGMLRIKKRGFNHCPAIFLANSQNPDRQFFITSVVSALLNLGIKQRMGQTIIAAADNVAGLTKAQKQLRKEMLKACGIKPEN